MPTGFRRSCSMLAVLAALVVAFCPKVALASPPPFTDGSFSTGWTATWLQPPSTGSAVDTVTGSQTPGASGVPTDMYRETTHDMKAIAGYVVMTGHTFAGASWNPAVESIVSLKFSYDLRHLISKDKTSNAAAAGFAVLIVQGGVAYRAPWTNVFNDTWQTFSSPAAELKAADFVRVDGEPGNPDFSCKGGLINLGYVTGNSNPQGVGPYKIIGGIDNWSVTLTTTPCATCLTFAQTKVTCADGPTGPSSCYTVTTVVTNNTGQPASFVMLGSTGVSPNVIPLVPPLPSGQSRPITFTYCPPTSSTATTASVDISLAGAGGEPCCRQTLRFDLPTCPRPECLWVPKYSTGCVTGAPPGTFKLWFNYRNMTNCPTNLFLLASPPSTATASYFAGPYMPFSGSGPTYNVPVTITGATSSTFCMVISQQCKQGGNCCSRTVCFTVPNCWPNPMPSPTPDIGRPPIDPNPGG